MYIDEAGHSIDSLWQLETERESNPQYSTWYIPEAVAYGVDIPSESEEPTPFSLPGAAHRRAEKKKKEKTALVKPKKRFRDPEGRQPRKAIMAEEEDDDGEFEGMPGLMSVSESSDDELVEPSSEEEDDDDDEEDDDESEWERDDATKMQRMLAEAMLEYQRRGGVLPPWTDESDVPGADEKAVPGNMKKNPFIKMLRTFAGECTSPIALGCVF